MALSWTLDKLGPMARSADDAALVLAAAAGHDSADESSLHETFDYRERETPKKKLRIAVPKGCTEKVQKEVRDNFEHSIAALGDAVTVTRDVEWPDFLWGPSVSAIVGAEGAAAFIDLIQAGRVKELKCPADRHGGYAATLIPAVDYIQAMRLRRPMRRAVAQLFEKFDAVASPARGTVAYPADVNFELVYPGVSSGPALIPAGNLCGLPALAMPNGYGENGLPTAIALMGPAKSEKTLVQLGNLYQSKTDWHLKAPPEV
jgi:aspartyl-tRNA(Asn)/glutamyl-tRNA(Gln) amidotransferase subunit A